jgi:hypothetical protein
MTIGLAFLAMILGLWSLGGWLGYQQRMKRRPRFEGLYRAPCPDVHHVRGSYIAHDSRPLEFC